ncbi:MAG TPA: bL35 family ribosomal protein [Patescibacteria group bacterium]|nr:bL35 family ribosomal protein [Patescibacteria group bacterium]
MSKTKKSIKKRFNVTKNNKVLHRTCGQNHLNSKESSKKTRNKRKNKQLSKGYRKTVRQAINS